MDTTYQIFEYLPLAYKNTPDAEYFDFLIHSVQQNYEAENYHFAVVALHMIYMGIVYYYIYVMFKANRKRFEYVLIGFHKTLEQKAGENSGVKNIDDLSWHNFSTIKESIIFEFYKAVGIQKDKIGNLRAPVGRRNDILHTNGTYINKDGGEEFEQQVLSYSKNLEVIHQHCIKDYQKLYRRFLRSFKIEVQDQSEAGEYLNQDFIKEYSINLITIKELSKNIQNTNHHKKR